MRRVSLLGGVAAGLVWGGLVVGAGSAQQPAAAKAGEQTSAPVVQKDEAVEAASREMGAALFLRCLCAENTLSFDAQGRLPGSGAAVKTTDWTLAGVNVLKVERVAAGPNGAGAIELEAVRVAIRYAPDRHEFDRHPQGTEKMKIVIADGGDAAGFRRALEHVFAMGIDVAFQHSLPEYWQHYFNPAAPWPKDELTGAPMLPVNGPLPPGATEAQVTHKADAGYTAEADRDKVAGTVVLRMFVDAEGAVRRVWIAQPLGYGLDERAVQASEKLRFTPATMGGKAVGSVVVLRQEFVVEVGSRK